MSEEILDHIEVIWVEGFPLQDLGHAERNAREVFAMIPEAGDIILATYPKCGTTWAQFIIWGILHEGAVPPNTSTMMFKEFPFLEFTGLEVAADLPHPRTLKVHLPFRLTPKSLDARYICVMRNPFDCCVSYYHQLNEMEAKPLGKILPFENYFRDFLNGTVPFGCYFEQVQSWFEHREDSNVLFLSYEDMKRDTKGQILKIAEFLGTDYRDKLNEDPLLMDNIIKHSSFDYMKENKPFRIIKDMGIMEDLMKKDYTEYAKTMSDPEAQKDDNVFETANFFRKGKVGSAKEELTDEQWSEIDRLIESKIKYPELKAMMRKTKPS